MSTLIFNTKLSSTQIGTIGENLLVNAVMKASNGRLSPFLPLADDDGLDLVAALFNKAMTDFDCTWFISLKELAKISNVKSNKYVITPSKAEHCKDKYEKYRSQTPEQLADRIIEECESSPKTKKLITAI